MPKRPACEDVLHWLSVARRIGTEHYQYMRTLNAESGVGGLVDRSWVVDPHKLIIGCSVVLAAV